LGEDELVTLLSIPEPQSFVQSDTGAYAVQVLQIARAILICAAKKII
jgi:hypothetical protein